MSLEKFNSSSNRYRRIDVREENSEEFRKDRRDFIKKGIVAGGGLLLGKTVWNLLTGRSEKKEKIFNKEEPEKEDLFQTTEDEEKQEEDLFLLDEILDFDKEERIELTPEKMKVVQEGWKRRYIEVPELKNSLHQAYNNMGEWLPYLKEVFQQENVPEKFLYLAIPESHWRLNAISQAKAKGPYQFIAKTARHYGLKSADYDKQHANLEERRDPIKSARACAKLLRDLYKAGNNDWDLALSGYNAGFFWNYLKDARAKKEDVSYEGLLNHLEKRVNEIRDELKTKVLNEYEVKQGETVSSISKKFDIDKEVLCSINEIENENHIMQGQKLNIPNVSEEKQKEIFKKRVRGIAENLNYPLKFNAIYELLEEGYVTDLKKPLSFKMSEVGQKSERYIFKKEDGNIYRISKKYPGVSYKDILLSNPSINPESLSGGEEILIPNKNSGSTLKEIAKEKGVDLERIRHLNPGVIDPDKLIPQGYQIRF